MAFTAGEEAVFQSGGVGTDVPGPLSRGKRNQQFVFWVSGVCGYTTSSCLNPAVSPAIGEDSPQSPVWFSPPGPSPSCLVRCSFCATPFHSDRGCWCFLEDARIWVVWKRISQQ